MPTESAGPEGQGGKAGHQIMIWSHAVDTKFKPVSHDGARS